MNACVFYTITPVSFVGLNVASDATARTQYVNVSFRCTPGLTGHLYNGNTTAAVASNPVGLTAKIRDPYNGSVVVGVTANAGISVSGSADVQFQLVEVFIEGQLAAAKGNYSFNIPLTLEYSL